MRKVYTEDSKYALDTCAAGGMVRTAASAPSGAGPLDIHDLGRETYATRIIRLLGAALGALLMATSAFAQAQARKPNILVIWATTSAASTSARTTAA